MQRIHCCLSGAVPAAHWVVLALHVPVPHQVKVLWPARSMLHQQAPQCAGDWEAGAARDAQDPGLAAEESEDEAAGDFEDIETGTRSVACVHTPCQTWRMSARLTVLICFAP